MHNRILVLALAILPTWGLFAQAQLSLSQAVEIALRENLDIQRARQERNIADRNENWGNAGFLPSISASAGYNRSVVDQTQEIAVSNDTSRQGGQQVFPNAASDQYDLSLTAIWTVFDGLGRIYNWQRLQLEKELSEVQLRLSLENVLLQVFDRYFEVALQQKLVRIAQKAVTLSQQRYQRAETAAKLGTQNQLTRLNALVNLRQDSIALLNQENQRAKALRELNLLLNFPIDTALTLDTGLRLNRELNYLELQEQALENSSALTQAELNRSLAEKQVGLAWSQRLPRLDAQGGYQFNRQENEGGFLRFTEATGWQLGLRAQWNLFSSYRTQTQIETARLRVFTNDLILEQTRLQLRRDLANAWLDYQQRFRIYQITKRNLVAARQNFERSNGAFKLGQLSNVALREAQLDYIRAKAEVERLHYQAKLAEVELQRVAGVVLQ